MAEDKKKVRANARHKKLAAAKARIAKRASERKVKRNGGAK